jgi:hypothetical protein
VFGAGGTPPPATTADAPSALQLPGEYRRPADAMFGSGDAGYEAMVRSGAMAAQGRQGPLDGAWTVADDSGTELYVFQLTDSGQGFVDGAWRDVRRTGLPSGSGFFAGVRREGARLLLRFAQQGGSTFNEVALDPTGAGWAGELRTGGETRRVTMRRR